MARNKWRGALLIASTALLLMAGGCKGKDEPKSKFDNGKQVQVTFRLALPQGDAYTYRAIQDEPEWMVKKLTMYTFNNDGSKLLEIESIDMTKLNPDGEAAYTYTKPFKNTEVGTVYRFLFVANDEVKGAFVGMTQADFEKLPMTKVLTADGTSKDLLTQLDGKDVIPMTGLARQGNSTDIVITAVTAPIQVTLTRVVARVDISSHIPNLTITKIYLRNVYDRTSVFPTKDANGTTTYTAPAGAQRVNTSAGFADLPANFKGEAGETGKTLYKAFYLYEGTQPEAAKKAEATSIIVEGTLDGGRHVELTIPFAKSSVEYVPVTVRRNYLYHVVLGDNTPMEPDSKLVFSIEDTPWNSVILNHEMQIISVEFYEIESNTQHYDSLNRTFYTNEADKYWVKFRTRLKGHTDFTVKQVSPVVGSSAKIEKIGDLFRITVPNSTETRSETIFEVCSNAAPEIKRQFSIVIIKDYINPNWK